MKKYISMTVTLVLVMGIGYVLLQSPNPPDAPPTVGSGPASSTPMSPIPPSANVTIKDGVQYITVNAKGGYSPQSSYAKGGMPTKLIVKTDGTYDCSSSLVIRSVWYRGMLPATGETTVDLTNPKSGETVQGLCGMGMYSFNVKFN